MTDPLNQCPECGGMETRKEWVEWVTGGVDVVWVCPDCEIQFVASLRNPTKEITR